MLHSAKSAEIYTSISMGDSGRDVEWRILPPFPIRPPESKPDMKMGTTCLRYILKASVRKVEETRRRLERDGWESSEIIGTSERTSCRSIPLS